MTFLSASDDPEECGCQLWVLPQPQSLHLVGTDKIKGETVERPHIGHGVHCHPSLRAQVFYATPLAMLCAPGGPGTLPSM